MLKLDSLSVEFFCEELLTILKHEKESAPRQFLPFSEIAEF